MENKSIEEIIDNIIEAALLGRASDIHIDPTDEFLMVHFRIDGILHFWYQLSINVHEGMMIRIKVLARLPVDDKRQVKDGKFRWVNNEKTLTAEVRVSMMSTIYGENAVLRIFDPLISVYTLEELGFEDEQIKGLKHSLSLHAGLVIVVGPTGSGKTTTLYSIINYLKNSLKMIVTIEDPIEQRVSGIRQIEVGGNTSLQYVTVLRSILRQDPDVIMIGEIRDKEGAELAIQCALTGHLVITTLHASSAEGVKRRLINMGIPDYLIEATLTFVLAQRLVAKLCLNCSELEAHTNFKKGIGCKECRHSGKSGRIVIGETLQGSKNFYEQALDKAICGVIPFSEVIALNLK